MEILKLISITFCQFCYFDQVVPDQEDWNKGEISLMKLILIFRPQAPPTIEQYPQYVLPQVLFVSLVGRKRHLNVDFFLKLFGVLMVEQ